MRIFLIHGMGRTPASMALMGRRLRQQGHETSRFGYLVTTTSLTEIRDRFVTHVRRVVADDAAQRASADGKAAADAVRYAVVGHSLGNIVTRMALPHLPAGFARFIMLAPPNRSPAMARWLRENPLFRAAFGDAGRRLADPAFYARLPTPAPPPPRRAGGAVPSLIIAGRRGLQLPFLPFTGANDGIVAVDETRLDGVPAVEVDGVHTFLMNRRDVFEHVHRFLLPSAAGDADTS
ncbi:MAG: hypothetical protein AAF772_02045 [Acidobacteriota bacterium]